MRIGADFLRHYGPPNSYRGANRARNALAVCRFDGDVGPSDFVVAGDHFFRAACASQSAVCASRAHASRGAPSSRLSRRHGAVRNSRHRHKRDRTGILIFVSLAERYARIIADEGIAACVPQSEWQDAVNELIARISTGHMTEGFISAIEICGNVLARSFPRAETSGDELPDRIYLI
ncbi:MAG: TPM domain-containing protein [Xanthobacteraceae bacterium]